MITILIACYPMFSFVKLFFMNSHFPADINPQILEQTCVEFRSDSYAIKSRGIWKYRYIEKKPTPDLNSIRRLLLIIPWLESDN